MNGKIKQLNSLLLALESNISKLEMSNNAVSASPVGWHIEHSLLVIEAIIQQLKKADPANFKKQFSIKKLAVFTLKKIPRGKAKAPPRVMPQSFTGATLSTHLKAAKAAVKELESIAKDQYIEHPFFGHLKLKQTIVFLTIHTNHHLAIINDIVKAGNQLRIKN